MFRSKLIWMVLAIVFALAAGISIGSKQLPEGQSQVIRTYVVPEDRANEIQTALTHLFYQREGANLGSVEIFSRGLMLVRAPEGFHRGIERLVKEFSDEKPQPASAVRLDYWIVIGQSGGKPTDAKNDSLGPISGAIDAIEKLDGARHFRVLEHLSTHSTSGEEVKIKGAYSEIAATAHVGNQDQFGLSIKVKSKLGEVQSMTPIKAGEYLILGQNAVDGTVHVGTETLETPANVYYIIHAETAK